MAAKPGDPTGDVPAPTVRMIIRAIRDAEVIFIGFPRLGQALIVDPRSADGNRPAAFIAGLGFDAEGQLKAVRTARPDSPPIEHFATMVWGGSTRAFAEQGVLPALLGRLPPESTPEAMAAFEQLRQLERGLIKTVGKGEAPVRTEIADEDGEGDEGEGDQDIEAHTDAMTRDGQ